jgi:rhamnulose-1-phosphate aldolase
MALAESAMMRPPFPELDDLLTSMGEAGRRLAEIGAAEGAAGNLSICVLWPVEARTRFPLVEEIELPMAVPGLAGATLLVTGSGQRLREILDDPAASIGCIAVDEGGKTGKLLTSERRRFRKVTSEFNSHLAVHADQMRGGHTNFLALVHAQPLYLTYMSHVPHYQDQTSLNANLMRWQPETILNLPEGLGFVPFRVPGSDELMAATVESLRNHRLVIWAKHGVMARSNDSIMRATEKIEYAETAAKYEYLDLCNGGAGERLSAEQIRAICEAFNLQQKLF